MQRAIEQAGSIFAGWITSCLFCLDSGGDDESARHQQAMKQKGSEREMQICHSQPHLVPPMRLVVYDDLPSPGPPPRTSSFPTWVMEESRTLAARASNRASMSLKRKSTIPVRISAPTDFRRVTTLTTIPTMPTEFCPLELSFESPANPLPDLPKFNDFKLDDQTQPLTRPPKTFSFMTDFSCQSHSRGHRPASSFNLPRKPVGSGSRRSSLATVELLMEKQAPVSHPLIPYFSTLLSTPSVATGLASGALSSPPTLPDSFVGSGTQSKNERRPEPTYAPASTTAKTRQEKALPSIPSKGSPSYGSSPYDPPATPVDSCPHDPLLNSSPSRSNRVTQWLLQTSSAKVTSPPSSPWKGSFSDKFSFRIRTRTLSGSTLAPSVTSMAPGPKSTHPLSSITTAATAAAQTSTLDSRTEKELELPISRPYTSRQTMSEDRTHPTIYEGQQHKTHYEGLEYTSYSYQRHSAIGVAY
ncbi:hypothetical protein P175DRAFT_0534086 [Aspergillus ochraceoroseus IBT 24754]|uniref:Uncharacterized protein n=2 Tax=Aspergillus ochraceoroseus TaxID=138278 RepID=A0A2T5LTN5_9EURO|nr:uncharacterized protein P175DRAFT_0534086 [Aspergillus ochraceoroseus IBT 24754]KKK17360.1 hypothetical protein AOCH_004654 [Aspergillus ochraceoroseus]PTU19639.1 hypothetical protein P175DRAFT_0534086 [Aspergillus ochraceoroseus IBT 24754]